MSNKIKEFRADTIQPYDDFYAGWPLPELNGNTWLTIKNFHKGIKEGAIFLLGDNEYSQVIEANENKETRGHCSPDCRYRCYIQGQVYYPMGFWGMYFNKFGLHDAYWILREYNPKWDFVRGSELREILHHSALRRQFNCPEPAIKSLRDEEYDYYLIADIERNSPKCRVCGKALINVVTGDRPVEIWWQYWDFFGGKYQLTSREIEKVKESAPMWLRHCELVCSLECEKILRKTAGHLIYERVQKWAKKQHEAQKIKRLRKLSFKASKALREGNRDVLKSLQEEFAQEATSRS